MFEVTNASPRVGATVRTTKQDMLSGKYASQIEELLLERSALAFPGMNFTDVEQLGFAGTIGKVFLVGGKETQQISLDPSINPTADYVRSAFFWHIDGANDTIPAKATMLSARRLSEPGTGDTMVANTFAAYEDLPDADKALIADLKVVHRLEASQRMWTPEPTYAELQKWQAYPGQTHPLVWTHKSGAKSLLLGASALYVKDMDPEESSALLTRLRDWATQPQYVFRYTWNVGDFLLWDNTGTMHKAALYPLDSDRLMLRTTLHGEEAIQ